MHPEVIESLAAGETSMSAPATLAPHRDDPELVRAALGKSKRQVQRSPWPSSP